MITREVAILDVPPNTVLTAVPITLNTTQLNAILKLLSADYPANYTVGMDDSGRFYVTVGAGVIA